MFNYIWPMALIIISNLFYQICAKSVPDGINPFATLTVTYIIGAILSLVLFFITGNNHNLLGEYGKLNWAPFVLGFAVVGLEAGNIYAYKAGWQINSTQIVQACILAVLLIFVGYFFYKESFTWNKAVGIGLCIAGVVFINFK